MSPNPRRDTKSGRWLGWATPEHRRATQKLWREGNRERLREYAREYKRAARAERGSGTIGPCAACGTTGPRHWDHDHQTGKHRGLLCPGCNLALGHARENVNVLLSLVAYLERNQ